MIRFLGMARVSQEILDSLVADCTQKPYDIVVSKWIVEKIPAIFNDDREEFLRVSPGPGPSDRFLSMSLCKHPINHM